MLKFITDALSSALGFSKTETRGTLVLIFIIFLAIATTQASIYRMKANAVFLPDTTTLAWVKKVQASYDLKQVEETKFDKVVSIPVKSEFSNKKEKSRTVTKEPKRVKVDVISDLNTASAIELQKVKGIGPAYSMRIVKYREILGGFADSTQLREVYGLNPEVINELLKQFQIESEVTTIDMNEDSIKILVRHPYISYDLAKIIINYRRLHGDINGIEDLKKIKAIDDSTLLRLKPYLE